MVRETLEREAVSNNTVLLRECDGHIWLAQYAPVFSRWTCVSPTRASISLTTDQLIEFGFTDVLLIRPEGLVKGTT